MACSNSSFAKQTAGLGEVPRDGLVLLRNRFFNKGTAFTEEERDLLGLDGVLPPQVETIHEQLVRVWHQFNRFDEPINKYQLLRSIQSSNNTLYYALIQRHLTDILPIIYTPTVGEACQKFGNLYQREHGIYVPSKSAIGGKVEQIIANARRDNIDVIVVTDGSRILGLGDLGTNGMGISIGKCSLYVAGAGVHPRRVLPVMVDAGTNNTDLRNDPLYMGQRIPRIDDKEFYQVMDSFMEAVSKRWPQAVVQFEDFSNNHCFDMLARYREKYRCFNDDIQGTGSVVSAGFFNAIQLSKIPAQEHRILVFGAGSAAVGVVNSIAELIAFRTGVSAETILGNVYLVDTKGLVTATRGDELAVHKVPFARKDVPKEANAGLKDLFDIVKHVKPTALIGLGASGPVFTKEIIQFIASYTERPIVFPLSNPTSKSEINPANAYAWTDGKAIVASGSPYPASNIAGKLLKPSQGNNMYIFPGVGLGCSLAQPSTISDKTLVRAASALVDMVTDRMLYEDGILYPPLTSIREVSKHVAAAVIAQTQDEKVATACNLPTTGGHEALVKFAGEGMWEPEYIDYMARDADQ